LGFGDVVYQVSQSVVYCSRTLRRSQDREIGSLVVGGVVAACLASASASSFPWMLVVVVVVYSLIACNLKVMAMLQIKYKKRA
jgi:uncharacterized membrane protein YgaE (UPF0421/DUF939 family)